TWIKAVADDGITQVADSFYYVVNPLVTIADLPAGALDGINYVNDSTVTLVLVAPNKSFVYAIGDFSNWQVTDNGYMNKTIDGSRWWITLSNLSPLKEYTYQFLVDGNIFIADPYADKILDPNNDSYISATTYPNLIGYPTGKANGIVSVFQTAQTAHTWQVDNFQKPSANNMVVYELLIRDFIATHNYQTLIDTINYIKSLGITAIELMPFNEFEGNESWGYNPDFYFAPDKYYGTKDALKDFIDVCHQNGIAVIQDMVLNHSFGQSPMCQLYWDGVTGGPSTDNPWFNSDCDASTPGYQGKHPYGVGYDFNHESDYTHKFVDDVLKYWVTEYKIDGFRFDLSKGFTQKYSGTDVGLWGAYDQSRINNLERMADAIWMIDSSSTLILEHFADNSEEKVLSAYGFYLWGNIAYGYKQSAMGYASGADVGWINYNSRGWAAPHVVGYMESHDEERIMYNILNYGGSNANYNVKPLDTALNRVKLSALFFIPVPGPKMIWQFGELGYDYSINYNGGNTANKPIKWDYFQVGPRKWLYNFYAALNELKRDNPLFTTTTFTLLGGSLKKNLRLNSATLNLDIVGNFDLVAGSQSPYFQHTGWWYEYFTGDSLYVSDVNVQLTLDPGEYRMYFDVKQQQPDLGNVGVDEIANANALKLFQNFPNPCNSVTTIDLYVASANRTLLQLFDLNGRLIETITDKNFKPGYYTVDFPVSQLTSGTYLLKLISNGKEQVVKMEVVK
ncbi:MAG: T9SS type A sorting domain-containing protein, partial [Chitinophagales bacterium]|nr:T9SS type A sorting domain-containing protein [Chitinophagales bacterium]